MKKAFTLIELLVVIAIIALLSTLSVVALSSARAKARDARRLSDIKQIQTALDMYLDSAGTYPSSLTTGSPLSYGGTVFLASVPGDPMGSNQYSYTPTSSGYTLDFALETKSAEYEPGNYQATPNGILAGGGGSTPPPPTWVCGDFLHDGSDKYKTNSKFGTCFMIESLKRTSHHRRCFGDDPNNCDLYGGLYHYGDSTGLCPSGWRLPDKIVDAGLLLFLADSGEQGFIGYFLSKDPGSYTDANKFLMLDEPNRVFDVETNSVVSIPWLNSAVSVRCIKE